MYKVFWEISNKIIKRKTNKRLISAWKDMIRNRTGTNSKCDIWDPVYHRVDKNKNLSCALWVTVQRKGHFLTVLVGLSKGITSMETGSAIAHTQKIRIHSIVKSLHFYEII